jgi:TetR/AcrR family transcriptional repressor of nem operon
VIPSARDRLIETASRLFHLRSYSSVGIQELCEEAGVRRGSFYYYFPSKEALVEAVLDYERDHLLEQVYDPAFEQTRAPLERFDEFLRRLHEYQVARTNAEGGQVGGCPFANLAQELASHHPKLRAQAEAILDRFADMYQAALEEGRGQGQLDPDVDTQKSAVRIRAYVQGLLETAKLRADPDVIAQCGLDVDGLLVRKMTDV